MDMHTDTSRQEYRDLFPGISSRKKLEYIEKFTVVCGYIADHCTENIDINGLAAMAGFSKFHFIRLFKQFTGMPCHEYITRKRVARAQQLLAGPDIPIIDVAMHSGFNSLATFNRIFRAQNGCTPTEYKKMHRSSAPGDRA